MRMEQEPLLEEYSVAAHVRPFPLWLVFIEGS